MSNSVFPVMYVSVYVRMLAIGAPPVRLIGLKSPPTFPENFRALGPEAKVVLGVRCSLYGAFLGKIPARSLAYLSKLET